VDTVLERNGLPDVFLLGILYIPYSYGTALLTELVKSYRKRKGEDDWPRFRGNQNPEISINALIVKNIFKHILLH